MTVEEALEHVREQPGWADALVCEYHRAAGLPNAEPRNQARHVDAMWEMRGFARPERVPFTGSSAESTNARRPLVGWRDGTPTGLTRLGALVAHELVRTRTRRRQVRKTLAELEIVERRARGAMYHHFGSLGEALHRQRHHVATAAEAMSGLVDEMADIRPFSSRLEPGLSPHGPTAADWRFDFADFTARQRFGLVNVLP